MEMDDVRLHLQEIGTALPDDPRVTSSERLRHSVSQFCAIQLAAEIFEPVARGIGNEIDLTSEAAVSDAFSDIQQILPGAREYRMGHE
jgi:hypothetical protein